MGWFVRKFKGGIRCLRENGFGYTVRLFLKKSIKKILGIINKIFRSLSKRLALGFVEIIKVRTYFKDERYRRVYFVFLFGKQIYPTRRQYHPNAWIDPNQPTIYFKINRMSEYVRPCVQHWVNIAYHMKADYYFICDNTQLQYHLLRSVNFPGSDIKFLPSIRKPLKKICKVIDPGGYRNANMTCAHLSPFYYAKEKGINKFWAIDADDTMICLHHWRAAKALKNVQNIANDKNISTFSLDMWHSRTRGRHWSWGVAYVNDNVDFINVIERANVNWWEAHFKDVYRFLNLDWFFTYLKDDMNINIDTFYIDNSYLIHWGHFLRNPITGVVSYWSKGTLTFPILKYVFQSEQLGTVDIADCVKIPFDAKQEEGLGFLENEVTTMKWWTPEARKLHNGGDFSTMQKSIERL